MMPRLLFVCTANIVRSAAAEYLARARLGRSSAWEVGSAGVHALAGSRIDHDTGAALERRGIDASRHIAHQLDVDILELADLVLTFEAGHRAWILSAAPRLRRSTLTIRRAAHVLDAMPRRAEPLAFLGSDSRAYDSDDDFADPYQQGPEVIDRAVAEIDQLLARILPGIDALPRR